MIKLFAKRKLNKEEIMDLLNKARYYHNYLCKEKKAIKLCNKILEHEPENRDALLVKAGSLRYLGKEKEAVYLIQSIMLTWPNHWEAYYLMGLYLFNTDEEEAMDYVIKSIKLEKKFDNSIAAAQLAYFMGKDSYKEYLHYAEQLDSARYKNYMEKYWEREIC